MIAFAREVKPSLLQLGVLTKEVPDWYGFDFANACAAKVWNYQ